MEDAEQSRRLSDEAGEQQKRTTAYLVSAMVEASLRPNWFQQGTSYVLDLLRVAKHTGNDILLTASQAREKVEGLGQRGIETARDLKLKLERTSSEGLASAQEAARDARQKLEQAGETISKKSKETAQGVTSKVQGTAEDLKAKVQEKAHVASEVAQETALGWKQNLQSTASKGLEKVQEVTQRLKNLSFSLADRVAEKWESMSHNSLMAFVVLEEEKERIYRMNLENQFWAVKNAFAVSALIKQLAPEFYRPDFEPSSNYYTKMMEESERARRIKFDQFNNTASTNAGAVSRLIANKFASATVTPLPAMAKPQFVDAIHVTRPLTPTM